MKNMANKPACEVAAVLPWANPRSTSNAARVLGNQPVQEAFMHPCILMRARGCANTPVPEISPGVASRQHSFGGAV